MLELRSELDLAPESFNVDGRSEIRQKNFHDDLAPQRSLLGDKYTRHSSAAELALKGVVIAERLLETVLEIRKESPSGAV
jgi:hypothetical protein